MLSSIVAAASEWQDFRSAKEEASVRAIADFLAQAEQRDRDLATEGAEPRAKKTESPQPKLVAGFPGMIQDNRMA